MYQDENYTTAPVFSNIIKTYHNETITNLKDEIKLKNPNTLSTSVVVKEAQ